MDENLENIRRAATCAICIEIYTQPKRLPNCSHVFCLDCLQRHYQVNRDRNFPPCPMCRKPILVSRSQVVNLYPGEAVQLVVALAKQFEKCDICDLKKTPNLRCEKCSAFICDGCLPCHNKLKRAHNVALIIPHNAISKRSVTLTRDCPTHDGQPLDLFCVICRRLLCILCEKFSHASCDQDSAHVHQSTLYRRGFLKFFVETNPNNQIKLESNKLGHTVYIKEFALAARQWLKKIQTELHACLATFQEVKPKLRTVGNHESNIYSLRQRSKKLDEKIDDIIAFAQKTKINIEKLLDETTSDTRVAEAVQGVEEDCFACFRHRQKYAGYMLLIDNKNVSSEFHRCNIQQSWACVLTEISAKCTCIMSSSYYTQLIIKPIDDLTIKNKIRASNFLSCMFVGREKSSIGVYENSKNSRRLMFSENRRRTGTSYKNNVHYIVNCMSSSKFLDKYELTNHGMFIAEYGSDVSVVEVENGYMNNELSPYHTTLNSRQKEINFKMLNCHITITGLVNLVALPTCYCVQGKCLNIRYSNNFPRSDEPFVIKITGNTGCGAGLQSMFLYHVFVKGDCRPTCLLGLSISTNVAKFNKHINAVNLSEESLSRGNLEYTVIKDKNNAFTFVQSQSRRSNINFQMSYRSVSTLDDEHDQYILLTVKGTSLDELNPRQIPLTYFTASLLCHLESGLYFAKHDDTGDLTVGDITFSRQEIKPNMLHTVRQADTVVPVGKLKPFTMVERTNKDIIVVCAIEDDNSKFMMIQVGRGGSEATEILEIDYSLSEFRVYDTSEADGKVDALDQETPDLSSEPKQTEPTCKTDNDVHNQQSTVRYSNFETNTELDKDTKDKSKDTKDKDKIAKLGQTKIQDIAEAKLVDLEMDSEGNIMFVLETNDGRSYCAFTKYLLP